MTSRKSANCSSSNVLLLVVSNAIIFLVALPSVSVAKPVHIRQGEHKEDHNEEEKSQGDWGSFWQRDDDDDGYFYGMPGFFLYPLPNSFFRGSSPISADINCLQIVLLSAGTLVFIK